MDNSCGYFIVTSSNKVLSSTTLAIVPNLIVNMPETHCYAVVPSVYRDTSEFGFELM